jgi:signal transduction histidine kinase
MWVESEGEGKGSTFTILLPYKIRQATVVEMNQTIEKNEQ